MGPRLGATTVAGVLLFSGLDQAGGAELYARKMEIVKTADGQVTLFQDSVSITDGDTRITARMARLSESRGVAVISESVLIQNPDASVWADSAVYRLSDKVTELGGDVRVELESLVITAPHLVYSIPRKQVEAGHGLVVENEGRGMRLSGRRGRYDLGTEYGIVDQDPLLRVGTEPDTVVVTGSEIHWHGSESRAFVAGAVEVGSSGASLSCDSLAFFTGPDSGIAWGEPEVRDRSSNTRGDTIRLWVKGGRLESVAVAGNATGLYQAENGERVEVAGQTIRIGLDQGEVESIEVHMLSLGRLVRRAPGPSDNRGGVGG